MLILGKVVQVGVWGGWVHHLTPDPRPGAALFFFKLNVRLIMIPHLGQAPGVDLQPGAVHQHTRWRLSCSPRLTRCIPALLHGPEPALTDGSPPNIKLNSSQWLIIFVLLQVVLGASLGWWTHPGAEEPHGDIIGLNQVYLTLGSLNFLRLYY